MEASCVPLLACPAVQSPGYRIADEFDSARCRSIVKRLLELDDRSAALCTAGQASSGTRDIENVVPDDMGSTKRTRRIDAGFYLAPMRART
jgi:hypothetical protein